MFSLIHQTPTSHTNQPLLYSPIFPYSPPWLKYKTTSDIWGLRDWTALSDALYKNRSNTNTLLLCPSPCCSWASVGPTVWPCSSWISMGRLSPREADVCVLTSCCLWPSPSLSCSTESEVSEEPGWGLDFILAFLFSLLQHLSVHRHD